MKLQAFEASNRKSLQSQMLPRPENRLLLNRFGGSSRPTVYLIATRPDSKGDAVSIASIVRYTPIAFRACRSHEQLRGPGRV
jgi:hypothetical protein